ncbi:MAG: hypothetical protein HKN50_12900 [Gammaproteobacteria bacterium]|nr:hypothetical protein [Gammaproteobacteria bacterium]
MFADTLFGPVKQWGYLVKHLDQAMDCWIHQFGIGPFWGFRNVTLKSNYQGVESDVVLDVGFAYQNGVQIELIHQTNVGDALTPYSAFYQSTEPQMFQQLAYHCPDVDAARTCAVAAGLNELGYVESDMGSRYYYFDSPAMQGMVVELMEIDQMTADAFEMCAKEAEQWDGEDPYRLISF